MYSYHTCLYLHGKESKTTLKQDEVLFPGMGVVVKDCGAGIRSSREVDFTASLLVESDPF